MTGIVKTDQLQGAQGTSVTVPTGHTLAVTSNATVGGTAAITGNTTVGGTLGVGTASPHADLHIQNETGTNTGSTELNLWVNDDRGRSKFNLKSTDDGTSVGTFKLTTESTVPSNTDLLIMNNEGMMTLPNQPAFAAIGSSTPTLAINTTYVLPMDTERFDQNGDFNTSNYTFTAPVTGRYQLNGSVYLYNYLDTSAGYIMFTLRTSNDEYQYPVQASMFGSDIGSFGMQMSHLVDMDASDTAVIDIFQQAGAAQTTISGGHTHFSGFLVC